MARAKLKTVESVRLIKLDLGCGPNKKEGFVGADVRPFPGVDHVVDLTKAWPWRDESVEEAHSSHFLEHLVMEERCHFMNELYRVLVPGGKATIITPHWCASRAYGDPTHKWPAVSEMFYFYLNKAWRDTNAPHTTEMLTCDFIGPPTWAYTLRQDLIVRNQEYQMQAVMNWKEAANDLITTVQKGMKS